MVASLINTPAPARRLCLRAIALSLIDVMTTTPGSRPPASSHEAFLRMVRQRRRDTKPEMAIRRVLHAQGLRYRVDVIFQECAAALISSSKLPDHGVRRWAGGNSLNGPTTPSSERWPSWSEQ